MFSVPSWLDKLPVKDAHDADLPARSLARLRSCKIGQGQLRHSICKHSFVAVSLHRPTQLGRRGMVSACEQCRPIGDRIADKVCPQSHGFTVIGSEDLHDACTQFSQFSLVAESSEGLPAACGSV